MGWRLIPASASRNINTDRGGEKTVSYRVAHRGLRKRPMDTCGLDCLPRRFCNLMAFALCHGHLRLEFRITSMVWCQLGPEDSGLATRVVSLMSRGGAL